MSWIDVAIASLVVIAALRGWSLGLLRQLGTLIGRVLGLVGGAYLAARVAPHVREALWRPLDVILIIVVATVAGGLLLRYVGGVFSRRLHENRLGLADSVLGASVGAVGMLLTCWFVAALLAVVPWSSVGQSINRSVILRTVQRVLPAPPAIEGSLQAVLSQVNAPALFADVVAPTLSGAHGTLLVHHDVSAPSGVVAVYATGRCDLDGEGSGFLVAPGEVVTTAQVVAGQSQVVAQGEPATVVYFNPRSDLAVLRAGVAGSSLALGSTVRAGTAGTVAGYWAPRDRTVSTAVILGQVSAPGRDLYSGATFTRAALVVAATTTAQDTGAPVLVNGAVVGVVAERAVADTSLSYALPVSEVRAALAGAASHAVSTQGCIN